MKKVGIIGGAGPLASALFYQTVIQECYNQAQFVPEIHLLNFPFTRGLTSEEGLHNGTLLEKELQYCLDIFTLNGIEIGILACNTLHLYLNMLPKTIPFVSLPETVMTEARTRGHHRILVLGTQNTCYSNLYCHQDLEVLYPPKMIQLDLDAIIDRVLQGKILQEDSHYVSKFIEEYSKTTSFDGIVLGCTDLPVLHHHFPIQAYKPLYDSIKIPAKKLRGLL